MTVVVPVDDDINDIGPNSNYKGTIKIVLKYIN